MDNFLLPALELKLRRLVRGGSEEEVILLVQDMLERCAGYHPSLFGRADVISALYPLRLRAESEMLPQDEPEVNVVKKTARVTCHALVEVDVEYEERSDGTVNMLDYDDGMIVGFEGPAEGLANETGKEVTYGLDPEEDNPDPE